MADRQPPCRKRGPAAVEPPEYVGATKTCTHCGSTEHSVFKFLNNKKPDQPRYKCMRCNTWYTHCPPGKVRTRAHGKKYQKHTLANPPEHAALFDLRCPNLVCRAANPPEVRFLYHNNNKPSQPRYVCRACHVAWQPKLLNLPPGPDQVAPRVSAGSWTEFYPDGAPDYMPATQAQQQSFDPAMGSCVGYPNGSPNFLDMGADALQLGGEQHALSLDLDPPIPEFYPMDADTTQGAEDQDAREADWGGDEWMGELFHTMDADTEQGAEEQDAREAEWGMDEWMGELFETQSRLGEEE